MNNFGRPVRPGGDPPPRTPLTQEQIRIRETFNREEHLRGTAAPASNAQQQAAPVSEGGFDETAARVMLSQVGLDLQVFPIGEKPLDPSGRNAYREQRLTELESERKAMRDRALAAESTAASAIRDLNELTVKFDTLTTELEALKAAQSEKETV